MNDCPNADVRDLLPDLVHGRLDAATRAMVESHIAGCADCRAELALLRDLRGSFQGTPRIDLGAIAAALPAYRGGSARRSWVGWRAAAAITILVAGGSSVALLQRNVAPRVTHRDSVATASLPDAPVTSPATTPVAPSIVVAPVVAAVPDKVTAAPPIAPPVQVAATADGEGHELAMGGGSLGDLSDRELASLLKDIGSLDAVPTVDVDNTPLAPIAPGASRRPSP